MAVVFDPFTGQLIDVGPTGMTIGGAVAGADPNSVLIVDGSYTLQNVQLSDGEIVTSQGGVLVASSITGNSASQISVDYSSFPNEIRLSLPQDIATTDSPQFANLYLSPNGSLDLNAAGTLNIGQTATTINIGNGVTPGNINLYGNTFYQEVVNLEVTDKNILLNKSGAPTSAGDAGLSIEEGGSVTAYAQISTDRNSWTLKAPNTAGIVTITPGASGFLIDQGSHDPVTIATPANGLSVDSNQELSIALVDNLGQNGALSSTKFIEFEQKVDKAGDVMTGNLDMETAGPGETLTLSTGGITSNVALSIQTTGTGVDGVLSLDAEKISASSNKIEDVADPVNPQDAMTLNYADNTYLPIDTFEDYGQVTKEPTGFVNRTDSAISFDDLTRTFSIQPTGLSYDFYIKGVKFTKTGVDSVSIPAPYTTGEYYIYFDATGTLVLTNTFNISIITDNAYVSIVYWNETAGSRVYFAEERHGLTMDGTTHSYLHTVFGARYLSGGALQGFSIDDSTNSPTDANSQFTADSGSIRDEDILITYPAQTQIPILYRIGTVWKKKAADLFPVIYTGSVGGDYAGTTLPYNKLTAGVWSLEPITDNKFVLVHIFATNDVDNPIIGIQGIAEYGDVSSARTAATTEIVTLSGLPFTEFVALGSVVFETKAAYSNTTNAKVRSISVGVNYVDFRGTQPYAPQYGAASSHSILSNLSSDDHFQYLNRDGSRPMTANLSLGSNRIVNVANPIDPQDAVTKSWIEDQLNDVNATYYDIGSLSLPSSTSYSPDGTTIANGDRVLFAFNNTIQIASGLPGALNWTADSFVATEGDVVAIKKGDIFGLQFAKFDGTDFQINNYVRYFNGSDYWEQSSPATIAIANNATTEILRIEFLNSENIIADYSLTRGTRKSTGTLHITTDGTDVVVSDTGVDLNLSLGVSFVGSIDGTEIVIECVADNSDAGTMKFMTRRWSDGAGGPAGIPSYNTGSFGITVKDNAVTPTVLPNINTLKFDSAGSGFVVSADVDPNTALIEFASTFKTWNVAGQDPLIASGTDTVEFIAGTNVTITTVDTPGSKSLTINATGGGGGPTEQTQVISNATTAAFTSYDPALKKGAKIEFALHRFEADGVTTRGQTGRILVISNGASTINIVTDSIDVVGSTGVTFTATYNGLTNEVDINYVSTNIGVSATGTMSYTVQTWS